MANEKQKRERLTTPRGRAIYPYLTKADTKFNADGEYKVKLAIPAKLADELIKQIDEAAAKAVEEAKKENKGKKVKEADLPYQYQEETDEFFVSFKLKATGKSKKSGETWAQRPALFDAKGKPVDGVKVGGGSTLRVSFEPIGFYTATVGAGVTLRMRAVQIIELKEYGGGDANSYGFDAQEDGYSSESAKAADAAEGSTTSTEAPAAVGDGSDF